MAGRTGTGSIGGMTRRGFMAGVGAAVAGAATSGWVPAGLLSPAAAAGTQRAAPPGFPASVRLYRRRFENWSGETAVDAVWTCAPKTADDVVRVVSWARRAGYRVRPRGFMHSWAPYTISNDESGDSRVVLVDTTQHLTSIAMASGRPAAVRVQTGATMQSLLAFLAQHGKGLVSVPAVGDISVGGALAIGGHGAAVPAADETVLPGGAYGSVSNLVLSLEAVVWDDAAGGYRRRTFTRSDPETKALLTHLGRAFITEVTLQVTPLQHLRCQSYTDISGATLFAPPATAGRRSFASFLDRSGRVEAILYPFVDTPWLKVWTVAPTRPRRSRRTTGPYGYPFSDSVPEVVSDLANRIIRGQTSATPQLGAIEYAVTVAGLAAFRAADLWGPAPHTQHYIRATTLRFNANGGLVVVPRAQVQRAVSELYAHFNERIAAYQKRGRYPINGPLEIRCSGLDRAEEVVVPGAEPPALSALLQRRDHPDADTAIWLNMLSFNGTPYANDFYAEMEAWMRTNYASYGSARLEWSKGWAYTPSGAWTDDEAMSTTIPQQFPDWDRTLRTFRELDPHRVFTSPLVDRLLP